MRNYFNSMKTDIWCTCGYIYPVSPTGVPTGGYGGEYLANRTRGKATCKQKSKLNTIEKKYYLDKVEVA